MSKRSNNQGSVSQRSDGRWQARVTLPNGKRKAVYTKTRREADKKLREMLTGLDQGIMPSDNRQTIEQYLNSWLESIKHQIEPSTYLVYLSHIRRIIQEFSKLPLAKLTPQAVQAFYAKKIAEGLALTTVNRMHATLKMALKDAVRMEILSRNIAELVKAPKYEPAEKRVLNEQEAVRLLQSARGERMEAFYVLVLSTGMRLGELLVLQWQDIDFLNGVLHVRRGLQYTPDGYRVTNPKSRMSRRTIALAPHVVVALQEHRQRQEVEKEKLGEYWDVEGDFVFLNMKGQQKHPNYVERHELPMLLKKAGLPKIHFHDLRHTAATLLLRNGVHVKVVSEMLGHSSIAITLRIYAHVLPDMQRDAANVASRLFGGIDGK
ncbi:MAG: tyrosine-type recombinase/integrase [Ktedonobacterales bacterium]|nr:tyrosine-type recombinase/integrase [Ktedonobacterales bacterium]